MPITPTYPGVYIQEVSSGVRTITGVATSVAAFIDFFRRGPLNTEARQVLSMGDFEREYGGLHSQSEASYAVQQFFLNGGAQAWIIRVASGAPLSATADIAAAGGAASLTVSAINEGVWGNSLRVRSEPAPAANEFNLIVSEYAAVGGRQVPVRQETFRNLSVTATAGNFAVRVINDAATGSKLVRVNVTAAAAAAIPQASGTLAGPGVPAPVAGGFTVTVASPTSNFTGYVNFTPQNLAGLPAAQALLTLAAQLQAALRAPNPPDPRFTALSVDVVANRLRVTANTGDPLARVTFSASAASNALLLTATATVNIQEYQLGGGVIANSAQSGGLAGNDGGVPGAAELLGSQDAKTGLYALEDVDLFNILCIPRAAVLYTGDPSGVGADQAGARAVMAAAIAYCEARRAFFIMDTPPGHDEPNEIRSWLAANDTLRHRNAALYYPRVRIADPLNDFRLRTVGASGTMAGLYARTDSDRGVWKAPAGTEVTLRNVSELDDVLTDGENGVLNPLAINCLRNFPVFGNISWGARTLVGSDQQGSEWKYVPVRRLALYLEESLFRGLKWVVFEPNDEPLWAQIRLNVGAFMHDLFRQGAFQGGSPKQAYLVKCDGETTTQSYINSGIVNIVVGFAPLKPAEFVILTIQQLAGQIQT